jgi:hypothetical protein
VLQFCHCFVFWFVCSIRDQISYLCRYTTTHHASISMSQKDDSAFAQQQSSSVFASSRLDDASQDFDGLEPTSSMRVRKKVAIGGITFSPEIDQSPPRKPSVLFIDPAAPSVMHREDDESSPQLSKRTFATDGNESLLSSLTPRFPLSPAAGATDRSFGSLEDTHDGGEEDDCSDTIVNWCNRLSTRAPCRIGGKRLSISLSWCVQWFLVINLTVLVIATSLLFNYYALTLVNDTAESFLYTALWQTQSTLEQTLRDMSNSITELTLSAGGATVVNVDNVSDTRWPGWQLWASPRYGLVNSTQAQSWAPERRLAHVAAVESCQVMGEGTVAIQLAYRLVAFGWLGGCIRAEFATGVSSGNWASEFIGFILHQKRVVWVQAVQGVTSSAIAQQSWTALLEAMQWVDDPQQLSQILQVVWGLQGSSLVTIAVDVLNNESAENHVDGPPPMVTPINTTWVLEP